jgi:hypothetical protein
MKNYSIDQTDKLYKCIESGKVYKHLVHHETFRGFCAAVRDIEKDLGEQARDDYWQELLRELKHFRFIHYAAPVPINFQAGELLHFLEGQTKNCQRFFPSSFPRLRSIINSVSALTTVPANPLLERISELVSPGGSLGEAILLKEAYLFPIVEELMKSQQLLRHVELVNKYQLRGARYYQRLFVIGPHYWFPDYVFRTPRSEKVYYIRYSWIPDTWVTKPIFTRPTNARDISENGRHPVATGGTGASKSDEDQEQESVPEINWHKLSSKIMKSTADDHLQEAIPARLYLLAGSHAAFLEASEHARILALDFETGGDEDDDEEAQQIRRLPVVKLQPGMFLLLRTEGGGDYIIPIANIKLGENAAQLRKMQEQWKERLRKEVETRGLLATCIDLLDLGGSKHVNETNLRNWMSNRSIRPQDDSDFSAIMRLIGLQDKETLYKDAADKIESAHRSAGFYIRQLLIKQVAATDLHEIHQKGYKEFELLRSDGGSLTAFRIEHISPTIIPTPASRIGRPVPAKDY